MNEYVAYARNTESGCNLFANLRVFLVGLGNSSEFLSFLIQVSEEIWRKIKYLLR